MSQLLKKYALLTACAVLALCFATRPAHAQSVANGGIGEHLLFAYWTTDSYTDTNIAIHSPLGVRSKIESEDRNVVHVVLRDDMGDKMKEFDICLRPGDTWTAALSMGQLAVGDPGQCDGDVLAAADPARGTSPMISTPMPGEMVDIGATGGYLEAWTKPLGTLMDDTVPCVVDQADVGTTGRECTEGTGFDVDTTPDDATAREISGTAMLVSPMAGFSSTYDATALMHCGNRAAAGATTNRTIAEAILSTTARNNDDGNGCWHVLAADATPTMNDDMAGDPIKAALAGDPLGTDTTSPPDKDILTGRWSAAYDENIMSHTKVVLTFPLAHLNHEGKVALPADPDESAEDTEFTDPVSLIVFNEMGGNDFDMVDDLMLDKNVNMCTFGSMPMMMDEDMGMMDEDMGMMDEDMGMMDEDMDMMRMVACNGMDIGELTAMAGGFRIFNNVVPTTGTVGTTTPVAVYTSEGEEGGDLELGAGNLTATPPVAAGGQVPGETLGAIGLIFSYFMGTDGQQYDQVTEVQWADVDRDGNDDTSVSDAAPDDTLSNRGADL